MAFCNYTSSFFCVNALFNDLMVDINIEMFSMIGSGTYLIIFSLVIGIKYSKSD